MDLAAAAQSVADKVTEAGVPATLDDRGLQIPGALVTPGEIRADTFGSSWSQTFEIYLIAPDNGRPAALQELGRMLALVQLPLGIVTAQPVDLELRNHSATPLPALQLTVDYRFTTEENTQ